MTIPPAKVQPLDLMEQTERLITKLVRNARSGRTIRNEDGTTRRVQYDILDQARAADAALKFLTVKNKLDPEVEETEFDREQRKYHERSGKTASRETDEPADGGAATTH